MDKCLLSLFPITSQLFDFIGIHSMVWFTFLYHRSGNDPLGKTVPLVLASGIVLPNMDRPGLANNIVTWMYGYKIWTETISVFFWKAKLKFWNLSSLSGALFMSSLHFWKDCQPFQWFSFQWCDVLKSTHQIIVL